MDNYVKLIMSVDRLGTCQNKKEYEDALNILQINVRHSKLDLMSLKKTLETPATEPPV